ncbi:MAG: hypothetical protein AB1730_28500 [Myxococcota bacterium]
MRHTLALALACLVASSGCGLLLSVRSACAQAAKCGQLAQGVTEDSCVAAWTTELERLQSLGRESCTKLARATQALFSCRARLTCEESADLLASPCAQEHENWVVASSAASLECH